MLFCVCVQVNYLEEGISMVLIQLLVLVESEDDETGCLR